MSITVKHVHHEKNLRYLFRLLMSRRSRQNTNTQPIDRLQVLQVIMHRIEVRESEVTDHQPLTQQEEDNLEEAASAAHIFDSLIDGLNRNANCITLVNFNVAEFNTLYGQSTQAFQKHRTRGPRPQICDKDALFSLLVFYRTANNYGILATLFKESESALKRAVDRSRPVLNDTLRNLWLYRRKRPRLCSHHHFLIGPYAAYVRLGLAVDSTTCPIYRPKGSFADAKVYWDDKNHIYGLKKEVAVLTVPPHYALFCSPAFTGSQNDFGYFAANYERYLPYLGTTEDDLRNLPQNERFQQWGIVGDKGYVGATEILPCFVHPKKKPKNGTLTQAELARNKIIGKVRVPVECFFGRMKKAWLIWSKVYTLDHQHFDEDFENCMLLTNQLIRVGALDKDDKIYYRKLLAKYRSDYELGQEKTKLINQRYRARKRKRIEALLPDDPIEEYSE